MTAVRYLTLGLAFAVAGFAAADDKKADKADKATGDEMLVGTWNVTGGKKAGNAVSDDGKKGVYVITKDTIKIMADAKDDKAMFVMKYTLDTKKTPVEIDMEITEGPSAEVKGAKAKGIVEVKDGELKIAYDPMGGDRPAKFDGEKAYYFTLKKDDKKKDEKKKDEKKKDDK